MERLCKELVKKKKYRDLGKDAESAILLFCLECSGGDEKTARTCQVKDCPLWKVASQLWPNRQ